MNSCRAGLLHAASTSRRNACSQLAPAAPLRRAACPAPPCSFFPSPGRHSYIIGWLQCLQPRQLSYQTSPSLPALAKSVPNAEIITRVNASSRRRRSARRHRLHAGIISASAARVASTSCQFALDIEPAACYYRRSDNRLPPMREGCAGWSREVPPTRGYKQKTAARLLVFSAYRGFRPSR